MTTQLTEIELDEVSLVDKGANQAAHVVLVKRSPLRRFADWVLRKNGEYGYGMMTPASPMPMSQVLAESDAEQRIARLMSALHESLGSIQESDLEAPEKLALMQQSAAEFAEAVEGIEVAKALVNQIESLSSVDEIPAALAAINKALGIDEGEGEDMTEPVKTEDASVNVNVEVEKADDVEKRLASEVEKREALEKRLAEMETLAKRSEVAARVEKTMGAVPGASGDDLVGLLMAVHDGAGAEVAGKVEALLVASSAAISESSVLDEVGKAAGAEVDAMSRARSLADEMRKSDPALTKEIALAKVFDSNPELAAAVYAR